MDSRTDRYLGRLCNFGVCPKGKRECLVPGCGSSLFLIGVDHSSGRELPESFTPILAESDLPEGKPRRALYKETPLLLVRRGSRIFCLAETCAHLGGPLSEGKLEGKTIVCPWHASRFDLATGEALDGPTAFPQPCLQTRTRKGQIEVRLART